MASVVDICNMALNRVGSNATIASLTEGSTESNLCATWFPQVRDYVLRDFPWRFATRRAPLAELAATAEEANGFPEGRGFKYAYPADCLMVRSIDPKGCRMVQNDQRTPYLLLSDGSHKAVYTDLPEAEITYTSQATDPTMFDPMFVSSVAYLLASEIALALSSNPNLSAQARQAYMQIVSSAAARDMNEGCERLPDSEFLGAYA